MFINLQLVGRGLSVAPIRGDPAAAALRQKVLCKGIKLLDKLSKTNRQCGKWSIFSAWRDIKKTLTIDLENQGEHL